MPAIRNPAAGRALVRLVPAVVATLILIPAALAIDRREPTDGGLLPDLEQELPTGLLITRAGARDSPTWRLGFRSAVSNVGDGPLIIDARRLVDMQEMDADQVILRAGAPQAVVKEVGRLRYVRSPDHRHWHLLGFERYELRHGGRRVLVADRKTGFCLGDRYAVAARELPARAPAAVYTSRCGLDRPLLFGIREGISVGYGDDYDANLEGQWLRLNGLASGRYLLVHRVNAGRRLRERSYANNASSLLLRVRWRRGVPLIRVLASCPDTEECASAR